MVHFCTQCQRWYHEPCIAVIGPLSDVRPPAHRLPAHLTAHRRVDAAWAGILAIPISRRYLGFNEGQFSTFEGLLVEARNWGDRVPADIPAWIRAVLAKATYSVPPDRIDETIDRIQRLAATPLQDRLVFKCPHNHFL